VSYQDDQIRTKNDLRVICPFLCLACFILRAPFYRHKARAMRQPGDGMHIPLSIDGLLAHTSLPQHHFNMISQLNKQRHVPWHPTP
jgi:hypothetical protein